MAAMLESCSVDEAVRAVGLKAELTLLDHLWGEGVACEVSGSRVWFYRHTSYALLWLMEEKGLGFNLAMP